MAKKKKLRIGITLGDVNGIGPEVALKAAQRVRRLNAEIVFIGDAALLEQQARALKLAPPKQCWSPHNQKLRWQPGKLDPAASVAAASWIFEGVHACLRGDLDAMVTAPISKEGFDRAGIDVPGHTELLADLCGASRVGMMLFGGPLRVVLATRHIPISAVPAALTRRAVEDAIALTDDALPWLGARRAKIAVCGLNPHAGDGGKLGSEDDAVIRPAVARARRRGVNVFGPLSGDAVFHHAAAGSYDAVVAMYHDQGLAPLKLIAFDTGVNLTLGLPIVRTSPDHGTAFDIAGKNKANPASMVAAISWAATLAARKNPWAKPRT